MKKPIVYSAIFLLSVILSVLLLLNKHVTRHVLNNDLKGGGEDIEGYYAWEHKRLEDPATGKIPNNIRALELAYAATLPSDAYLSDERIASTGWASRGAWNIGGRTRAFAADITNESVLLAGTCSGGMWRSTDTGKSWALVTPLAIQQGVSCLTQDVRPGHTQVWYYGSGEAVGASASGGDAYFIGNGIYRSLDDGQTWKSLTGSITGSLGEAVWSIVNDPHAPDSLSVVYASSIGGIYRTADSGRVWTEVLGGNSYYTDVNISDSGIIYATLSSDAADSGLWRSTDGIHFTNITPPGFPTTYDRIVVGISPKDPNQVYFLANTPGFGIPDTNFQGQVEWNSLWKYKYISGDGSGTGGMWFNLSANLPSRGGLFDKYNCQGSYDMVVRFLPNDTATVFIGGTDIFRSTTGFFDTSHTAHIGGYAVGTGYPLISIYYNHHPDQHVIFFSNSNPYLMYSGCDGGVFKTYNDTAKTVSWTPLNNGYITTMFYAVTSDHARSGGQVIIGGAQDNNSLFDNSSQQINPWTKPFFGDGAYCYIVDTSKVFYYSEDEGKIFKAQMDTVNGTVTGFRRIDPIGAKGYQFVNPYVIDPNNNAIMYLAGGKYLWRNNNLAGIPYSNQWDSISTNWVRFTDSVPDAGSTITALAVSTTPANLVYYGTDQRYVYRVNKANVGTPTPVDITSYSGANAFPHGSFYVSCITVDPNNGHNLIVTFSNYNAPGNIFYSSDSGASWNNVSGNLSGHNGPSVRWAAIQHLTSGNTIYWIGASTGLYATDTLIGTSTVWVQQATNTIGNTVCDMIDVRPSDGLVSVATHGHGIYTSNITNISQIATVHDLQPHEISNNFNIYPNPFAEEASISFILPNLGHVQVNIFDVQGRLVQQLDEGDMQPGAHILPFDMANQPAGIYFCNLLMGNSAYTKRVVLVR